MILEEFRKFILKGNVIDLSTGVIIGASFNSIVGAVNKGVLEPLIRLVGGNPNFTLPIQIGEFVDKKGVLQPNYMDLGLVLSAVMGFLITAAVVFFVIIKPFNKLMELAKIEKVVIETTDQRLLREIRDLLSNRQEPRA
jgi:large conductance mechanosensitive channel